MKRMFLFAWIVGFFSSGFLYSETIESSKPTQDELKDLLSIQGKVKGEIVFQSKRGPNWSIWKMNADGSGLKKLSQDQCNDQDPIWSDDGKRIYFCSDRSGNWQIYSMNENGRKVRNLSQSEKNEILCGVSPDQSKLYFQTREDGLMRFFAREVDSKIVYEFDFSEFQGREGKIIPQVSPNGEKVAFLFKSGRGAKRSIYVGDVDKAYRVRNIIPIHLGCYSVWAKDSRHFIMCVFVSGGTALHLAAADGSSLVPLTEGGRWNYFPSWSPDEEWFVWAASPTPYHEYSSGLYDIYIASMKDKKPIRLTFNAAPDTSPSWRP